MTSKEHDKSLSHIQMINYTAKNTKAILTHRRGQIEAYFSN